MGLQLEHEFTFWASVRAPLDIGEGPFGARSFFEVSGGQAVGERFTATAVGGGGDWVLAGGDGFDRIDVRMQFKTDDGAFVYIQYLGLMERNDAMNAAMATGSETSYEDHYFRTTPRLETGDARYAWLNTTLFAARGRLLPRGRVEYEVYRVV